MEVEKTIVAKIVKLTKRKDHILRKEYRTAQKYIKGEDVLLYSATKQAMDAYVKKPKKGKEYPLFLRNDVIKIEKAEKTEEFDYWFRFPTKQQYGGVWLPIRPHQDPTGWDVRDSKIVRDGDNFYLHISVKKEINEISYSSILAVDLGERVMATTVLSTQLRPQFYGREIRGIRRHYTWLRKRLGEKKLPAKIKDIGNTEKRKVEDRLHKISRAIVDRALENKALIVLGDLRGIRNSARGKGKRMNRIVTNMPYYKLTRFIEYKAREVGIRVIKIDERNTSNHCSCCGEKGKRPHQGLFRCSECGYEVNADYNGAKNILKRSLEYISSDGAMSELAQNLPEMTVTPTRLVSDGLREEAPCDSWG